MINEIKSKNSYTNWVVGKTIRTSGDIGSVVSYVEQISPDYNYQIIPCLAGSEFTLTLAGATYGRAWCFVDEDDKIVSHADTNVVITDFQIVAPCNGKLIVNNRLPNPSVTGVCRCDKIQHKDGEVRKVYCNEVLDDWVKDKGWYTGDKSVGDTLPTNTVDASGVNHQRIPCHIGDKFTITLKGGSNFRGYIIVDNDNKIVLLSVATIVLSNTEIVAPCDGYLIVQNYVPYGGTPSVKKLSKIWYPHGLVDIGANQSFSFTKTGKYIGTGGSIGSVVDFTESTDSKWGYDIVSVKKGDKFTLTCAGGSNARAWCFTDSQRKIVSHAEASTTCTALSLTAPCDGYFIVNHNFVDAQETPSLVRTNAHTYPTIKIGTREWLGANLDETLGKIQTDEFYYNNDKFTYGKYGKLYKWTTLCSANETHSTALAGILPSGWRLAKKADFDALVALDGTCNIFRDEGYGNGSNLTNFSAVTGGIRKEAEGFMLPTDSFLWSSTGNQANTAWRMYVKYDQAYSVIGGGDYRSTAFSVRLVRDLPVDQVVSLASPSNDESNNPG